MKEQYTRKASGWYRGCGCGQKQGDLVTPPPGSTELLVLTGDGERITEGPISKLNYQFIPNAIAIDIDPSDAPELIKRGLAKTASTSAGYKGYLARVKA